MNKIFCLSCEDPSYVFVYGANMAGKHGASGAKHALQYHDAKWGATGLCGNSYGINTKDAKIKTLSLEKIQWYIGIFLRYAESAKDKKFFITKIGTGLASYRDEDIAPMFKDAPENCVLAESWKQIIKEMKGKQL